MHGVDASHDRPQGVWRGQQAGGVEQVSGPDHPTGDDLAGVGLRTPDDGEH